MLSFVLIDLAIVNTKPRIVFFSNSEWYYKISIIILTLTVRDSSICSVKIGYNQTDQICFSTYPDWFKNYKLQLVWNVISRFRFLQMCLCPDALATQIVFQSVFKFPRLPFLKPHQQHTLRQVPALLPQQHMHICWWCVYAQIWSDHLQIKVLISETNMFCLQSEHSLQVSSVTWYSTIWINPDISFCCVLSSFTTGTTCAVPTSTSAFCSSSSSSSTVATSTTWKRVSE